MRRHYHGLLPALLLGITLSAPVAAAPKDDKARAPSSTLSSDADPAATADAANALTRTLVKRYEEAPAAARLPIALELVDQVARDFDRLLPATIDDLDAEVFVYILDDKVDNVASRQRIVEQIRKQARQFAARKHHRAELFFLSWMRYGLPADAIVGHARTIHRRAAETGLLEVDSARSARRSLASWSHDLVEEGRIEEAVRVLDDSFAELDAANLHYVDDDLVRVYIEALTLARRDAQADAEFDGLVAWYRNRPSYANQARDIQLLHNQTSYYRNIAGRFAASEASGRFAAAEAERLMGRDDIATQKARYNYALALLGQGKAIEALPYFEEALPLQREAEANPWSRRVSDTIILLTTLARARAQVPGQEANGLKAAIEAASKLRTQRSARLAGRDNANPAVAALAKAVARGNRRDPLSSAYDMALFAGWAARAVEPAALPVAFLAAQDLTLTDAGDAINEAAARNIAGPGPLGDLVRTRQDVAASVVMLSDGYARATLGRDEARTEALRQQRDARAAELAILDASLARDFPDYSSLVAPQAIDLAAIQALLAPDEAVLMLLPSEGHHYSLAVSKHAARWHRVDDGSEDVAAQVARLKCRIDEMTCSVADFNAALLAENGDRSVIDKRYPRYDRATAFALYQQLIAPVVAALPANGRIYTVASGPIAGLPLAALVASPPTGNPQSGSVGDLAATDWLASHYRFITLPSVSALALAQRNTIGPGATSSDRPPLIAYGAPTLLGSGAAAARATTTTRRRGGVGVRSSGLMSADGDKTIASVDKLRRLDPLPGTIVELTKLSAVLSRGGGVRLGERATETAVKADTDLPRARTVVFATHGLLPGEMGTGSEPGLVLTPPSKASNNDDGLLTASEAAALSLSARWVVLSACNTATPGVEAGASGESLSSLARSFLYAGADNLLASHWRVADDATAALTVEALSNEMVTPAIALAAAMAAVRTGKRTDGSAVEGWQPHWAHPASWAPFTLVTNRDR